MARVIVETDSGRRVGEFHVPDEYQGNGVWRDMLGRLDTPMGWLGRQLRDARIIEAGGDPERLSEKVMRMLAEERSA